MKFPKDFIATLEKLLQQLYELLPNEARPPLTNGKYILIAEEQISENEDIHCTQRFYNIVWLILNQILPDIKEISSYNILSEYLSIKMPLIIEEQWSHILLNRIESKLLKPIDKASKPAGLIPQDQLETNHIDTLFMQLAYNLFYICMIGLPQQKEGKSFDELKWLFLNESQRIVEQLKLPVLNYIANLLPETEKPIPGETIPNKNLSQDIQVQFFQRLYNISCILANEIFPKLQGKCHSIFGLIKHLINPSLKKVVRHQVVPFLEAATQSLIDSFYQLIPAENQPKTAGNPIKSSQLNPSYFKTTSGIPVIAALYNVACQIKTNIIPRIKKIDAISPISTAQLIKSLWDCLDEIQPLLENLQPLLDQLKIFFIHDLYQQLSENDRPNQCGKLIPDEQLSKTDTNTFFIQKCYNLACFIFNQIIPSIKKCFLSISIFPVLVEQEKDFTKHFQFIDDLITKGSITLSVDKPDNTDSTQMANDGNALASLKLTSDDSLKITERIVKPFLDAIEGFLGKASSGIIVPLISFCALLLKEATSFARLSSKLANTINVPVVTGELSYYGACYISQAMQTLINCLEKEKATYDAPQNNNELSKEQKEEQNNIIVLINNTSKVGSFINLCFGIHENNSFKGALGADIPEKSKGKFFLNHLPESFFVTEETKAISAKLNELTNQGKILNTEIEKFLNNSDQKSSFITEEVKQILNIESDLYHQYQFLNDYSFSFSVLLLKSPQTCEDILFDNSHINEIFDLMQKEQSKFQESIKKFSVLLLKLPKGISIIFSEKNIELTDDNYLNPEQVLSDYKNKYHTLDETIKNKTEIFTQLKANNSCIRIAYENLLAQIIQPTQAFLERGSPAVYQFDYHEEAHRLLSKLKQESFSKLIVPNLPYPNVNQALYEEKIESFQQTFATMRQELIEKLEQTLTDQKTLFNQYLKATIDDQIIPVLGQEITAKKSALVDTFKNIEKESGETHYFKNLKDTEDWLAKITTEQLILNALDSLKLANPALVKEWIEEFRREEHQQLSSTIENLKTPLIRIIKTQRMEFNANNQEAIDRLQNEINDYQTKIELFGSITTLKQQQQEEIKNLQKPYQKPAKHIQETIEKINKDAEKLNLVSILPYENLTEIEIAAKQLSKACEEKSALPTVASMLPGPPPNMPPPLSTSEILTKAKSRIAKATTIEDIKISNYIRNLVRQTDEFLGLCLVAVVIPSKKETVKDKKRAILVILEEALKKLPPKKPQLPSARSDVAKNTSDTLNELLETLNKAILAQRQEAKIAVETLNARHEASLKAKYQNLYAHISKEKWPSTSEIYLSSLKKELQLKKLQFELAKVKTALNNNRAVLKAVTQSMVEKPVPNAVFKLEGPLTAARWDQHYKICTKQLIAAQAEHQQDKNTFYQAQNIFKQLTQQIQTLGEKITSIAQSEPSEENIQINALSSLKESIQKQTEMVAKEYIEVQNRLKEKAENLQNARKLFIEENEQAGLFNQHLFAVDYIKNRSDLRFRQVQARSPSQFVNSILNGTQKNPTGIFIEDQFYENTHQSIIGLKAQLDELKKNEIKREGSLSVLETAFNQALAEKIAHTNNSSLIKLETEYKQQLTAWQTFSDTHRLIKNSRTVCQPPSTAANYCGYDLRKIELDNKNFQNIPIENANFSYAKLMNCNFSNCSLDGVNFSGVDLHTCEFNSTNFKNFIIDKQTQFNWQKYGDKVLLDNLADPYYPLINYPGDLSLLMDRCSPGMTAAGILAILQAITEAPNPQSEEKTHLIAQQARIEFVIKQLVPRLNSITKVVGLYELVSTKKYGDTNPITGKKNPFAVIRRELDFFRFKYGNTNCWKNVIEPVKNCLLEWARKPRELAKLNREQQEQALAIMRTHTTHDYGFGFFYTPPIAKELVEALKSTSMPKP